MTTNPMDLKTVKIPVMSPICSRVVLLQFFLPPILCIIHNHFASFCFVSMMWETLWPSFDMVVSRQLQLIIWEFDREIPFQYLRALPTGKVLYDSLENLFFIEHEIKHLFATKPNFAKYTKANEIYRKMLKMKVPKGEWWMKLTDLL